MLTPDPRVVRGLLARYAELRIAGTTGDAERRALDDVVYTLCVLTGTTTIGDALERADALLAAAPAAPVAAKAPPPDDVTLVA